MAESARTKSRSVATLLKWLSFLALISLVPVAWFVARNKLATSHNQQCQNRLEAIGVALSRYHDEHRHFPPAYVLGPDGKPWHSWRVLVLPHLDQQALFDEYRMDEPWDGPSNRRLIGRMPEVYNCPSENKAMTGITNYLAVVGPSTAWPEQYWLKAGQVFDGLANTIHILENSASDVVWTEPRDIPYTTARRGLGSTDSISSRHDRVNCLLMDGTSRGLPRSIEPLVIRTLLSVNRGEPFSKVQGRSIADEVKFSELKNTSIVPHTEVAIENGKSIIYCATFQLAWDQLKSNLNAPIRVADNQPLVDALNSQSFPIRDLSPQSFVALSGVADEKLAKQFQQEFSAKFPSTQARFTPPVSEDTMWCYAYLYKNLPFAEPFNQSDSPLRFRHSDLEKNLAAFGVEPQQSASEFEKKVRQQVRVNDYVSDNDFVITLRTTSDLITLAKISPASTLSDTIRNTLERKTNPLGKHVRQRFEENESLAVPFFAFNVDKQFDELVGLRLLNPKNSNWKIGEAQQSIKFRLDQSGATLDSDAYMAVTLDDSPREPPKPRHLIFDKPFLLVLQEAENKQPYLAIWVGNAELCVGSELFRE